MDFETSAKRTKRKKRLRSAFYTDALKDLMKKTSPEHGKTIKIAMAKGASNWITTLLLVYGSSVMKLTFDKRGS